MRVNGHNSGFTLVELVAAIVLLGIAVPPMIWATRQSQYDYVGPVLASRARWLATEKLEDIIADRHSSTRGYDFLVAVNYPDEGAGSIAEYAGYSRRVEFVETTGDLVTPGDGFLTATVVVEWMGPRGGAMETRLSTVLTEYVP